MITGGQVRASGVGQEVGRGGTEDYCGEGSQREQGDIATHAEAEA